MDRTLVLLQNADPADSSPDSPELIQLEGIMLNIVNVDLLPETTAVSLSCAVFFISFCFPPIIFIPDQALVNT